MHLARAERERERERERGRMLGRPSPRKRKLLVAGVIGIARNSCFYFSPWPLHEHPQPEERDGDTLSVAVDYVLTQFFILFIPFIPARRLLHNGCLSSRRSLGVSFDIRLCVRVRVRVYYNILHAATSPAAPCVRSRDRRWGRGEGGRKDLIPEYIITVPPRTLRRPPPLSLSLSLPFSFFLAKAWCASPRKHSFPHTLSLSLSLSLILHPPTLPVNIRVTFYIPSERRVRASDNFTTRGRHAGEYSDSRIRGRVGGWDCDAGRSRAARLPRIIVGETAARIRPMSPRAFRTTGARSTISYVNTGACFRAG